MSEQEKEEKFVKFYKEICDTADKIETFLNKPQSMEIDKGEQYDLIQEFHLLSLLRMVLTSRLTRAQIDILKYV